MKTSRTDIDRDKRQTICKDSSILGYSSVVLRCGDLFVYREDYTNGTSQYRLAKCHGRIKGQNESKWQILAQAASTSMQYTYERWIDPGDVTETIPQAHVNEHIAAFFIERETADNYR